MMLVAAALAGCASNNQQMARQMSEMPAIGLPANAPERPADQYAYPAVHDIPQGRSAPVLSLVEQQQLEDDLTAARDQQQAANASASARNKKKRPPSSPAPVIPVSSSRTIY